MKRYSGNYIVRWTDKKGTKNRKTYTDYATALKAKNWLLEQGIDNIDIAVEVG